MAGIGFELRRILRRNSYLALIEAYGYAGIVSSGPWLLSIFGILLLGFLAVSDRSATLPIIQFQVSVTYLIAVSLIFTGPMQLLFTRYIADMLFARQARSVVTILLTMLVTAIVPGAIFAILVLLFLFQGTSLVYQILMGFSFVELCGVWVLTIMGTSLKDYKALVSWYFLAYATVILLGVFGGRHWGLPGYLAAFAVGQMILLLGLGITVIREFPGYLKWPKKRANRLFWSLSLVGLAFNAAIWADKFLFWFDPATGEQVIGPLYASPIYDVPIFLSYLTIVPGLAVFLFRLETDFVEAYQSYNRAIVEGGTLAELHAAKIGMVMATRAGLWDIAKIQGATVLLAFAFTPQLLHVLGYSQNYARIFEFDVVGVSLQLLLMSLLNVYFYLDLRVRAMVLSVLFFIGNLFFTWLTLRAGPFFYGMGFVIALFLVDTLGIYLLARDLERIDYLTFIRAR
ncbi:exopolysaccharide Pel transporter PelG [Acidithiobacillus sp. CV18-2]|uniref:Exopolysaccharide Pel transporter PelG n=1 Tax=Igneacidithiobacillus copahuensis TaxID=2724909 RepID=A0AAE2YQ73_9PROT|nr:exopolysaccharide Pel transporter PelG [Igneacidithiobacillus copahuensis]MBU2755314.1 exopolysaccharide Pel transporter PelG [Acidithiobacillus sp. CV18-3]MBU2756097.1 exopolysaccharide Pel transporter PelG [Acidithiobacillus sp. BN09-2]MBU2778292.1 exopolysaccharide Pel transporter PelG [Acidithiobacillus sp. CV18-2]MBU2796603.1 exopolysaccharide Pel transporter PelG [Acidithiobacillus sp. VAN18-2]MBU2797994.1 exopolysaccharide Pel transporter PelG [Acidithiobacillus sp. VAN18-4]UTV81281